MSHPHLDAAAASTTAHVPKLHDARFATVLHAHRSGRGALAREALGAIVDDLLRAGDRGDLHAYIFASALAKRLDESRQAEINLYLRQFAQPQIALFSLVAHHLPTVGLAGRVANDLLCQLVARHAEVTLLDVGIGTGRQEVALLHELARRGALPERLTVIAVEPDHASLSEAQRALEATARELALPLRVLPLPTVVEALGAREWGLVRAAGGTLLVHGAFAVHHMRPARGGADPRDALFARLRELGAEAVVLCEPNADHHTTDFEQRFTNCWRHFGQTFELIDRLDVAVEHRDAMKIFFAREIEDILANAEESRCERHESVASWVARLRRAGFTPRGDLAVSTPSTHPLVAVRPHDGYVGLDYADETLVAIVCATAEARGGRADDRRP